MAPEKVTSMVIKVDLQCPSCYRKIKKILCKVPQVRDQVYDEKANTVGITVICCCPERVRDKLCSRAGKVIRDIEIVESKNPEKPKSDKPEKPKDGGDKPEEPKDGGNKPKDGGDKPKDDDGDKPKNGGDKPKNGGDKPKNGGDKPKNGGDKPKDGGDKAEKPPEKKKEDPPEEQPAPAVPVNGVPSVFPYLGPTYDGYTGAYFGYPAPPAHPLYEGFYGPGYGIDPNMYGYRPVNNNGYGYAPMNNRSDRDGYFSEENSTACSLM